jgi:hypothetical protein
MFRIACITVTTYCCWDFEQRSKLSFIQMAEIKTMNDELRIILTKHMADGILLVSDVDPIETDKIKL